MEREAYIDYLKGIAIFLVVLGHCWLRSDGIFWLIYRFHMPLFFCISGYLFNKNKKFKDFIKSKFKTLIIPYFIFFLISYITTITILKHDMSIPEMLKNLILNGRYCSLVSNWAIWYLPLFFIVSNVFYFIAKIKNKKIFIAILVICMLVSVPVNNILKSYVKDGFIPFSIQVLPIGIFYMGVGYLIKTREKINIQFNKIQSFGVCILFFLGLAVSINNSDQIINITTYIYILASLMIMPFIIFITKNNSNKIITYIGRNSLIILGFHRIILQCMKDYKLANFLKQYKIKGDLAAILVSILCVFIICIINEIIVNSRKYLKIGIDKLKEKNGEVYKLHSSNKT